MEKGPVVILGAGGHARVVVATLMQLGHRGGILLDDAYANITGQEGWAVSGPIVPTVLKDLRNQPLAGFIVGIGSVNAEGCALRDKFYQMALSVGLQPVEVISPMAVVMGDLGLGVFVGPRAIVMPGAVVGANAIINTGAIVEHDCDVGLGSHIATGAVLCGGVVVGKAVHVGAGAMVKQGVVIGDGATIGMGAVVLTDVGLGATVVGNPAQDIEKLKAAMARLGDLRP